MDFDKHIIFEDYLNGEMKKSDRSLFEKKLKTDPELMKEFRIYIELSGFLKQKFKDDKEKKDFVSNLESISNDHFKEIKTSKHTKKHRFTYIAIAASILLFIGIQFFNIKSLPSYNDYASYNTISIVTRGDENKLLYKAENAFNNKKYDEAANYFKQLLQNDNNTELKLYLAISLIEINQLTDAENILKTIINSNSIFKNKATWVLALSKLKAKNYEDCLILLQSIPKESEEYEKASQLIQELKPHILLKK